MKKENYQRPAIMLIAIGGKGDLMQKGNIHFSSEIDHNGGRVETKENSGDLWEDDEFDPQKFEGE